ncbi:MAG: LytTR family DNA-binding domain-containing protein [Dysgonomonas sp.]
MNMRILIIEDEKHNASRLQRLLLEIDSMIEIVAIVATVKDSTQWFNNHAEPDVVLMDIRLSDGLSFDIFDKVQIDCPIIFTTSYDEYAVRAFKVNSIDYLLKPIEKEELKDALNKVKHIKKKAISDIEQLIHLFQEQKTIYRKRFLIAKHNGYKTIVMEDVDYFFSELKITYLITSQDEKIVVQQTLEDLEDELDPDIFFRANRKYIININSIRMIENSYNGKLKVLLKKAQSNEVIVSKEKAPLLKRWLDR